MLTAEELRSHKQKRRRVVLLLVSVLLLGLAVFFAARPTRNAIKGWQSRRHAAKAFEFIEQAKWNEARNEAVAAYQLRPSEPQALRAIARFLSRTRQQQALEFWDQLAKRGPLTRDDLRDEAAVAMVSGDLERASVAVGSLLGVAAAGVTKPGDNASEIAPRDWLLAAQLRLQQGAPEKALDSLGKLFAQPGASSREQFQATLLQLQSARTNDAGLNQRIQTEAWQRLNKFAQGDDAVALDSLVLLAQRQLARSAEDQRSDVSALAPDASPNNKQPITDNAAAAPVTSPSPSDIRSQISDLPSSSPFNLPPQRLAPSELIRRLESHPLAQAPQKLLAIDLQLQATPGEKEALVSRAVAEWKDADPAQLVVLATWLNGKGEFQRQLDEIPQEKALGSRELFLQRMDALGALGRWDEIRHLLESERFPLDQVMQRMYMARTNAQLGNEAAAKNNWERALEAANGEIGKLISLAEYAEKNGASDISESAYSQSTAAAPKLRGAWQGELRCVYAKRDTKRIHAILAEMLKLWPNDTAIQNDEAYTRLLLLQSSHEVESDKAKAEDSSEKSEDGSQKSLTDNHASDNEQLIAIEQLAQGLVRREPSSLPHRTLLALALLKQQRPVAALDVYSGINVTANALTPSALAVHAAVLAANDQREAAREEISHVPTDKLLSEEHAITAGLRE